MGLSKSKVNIFIYSVVFVITLLTSCDQQTSYTPKVTSITTLSTKSTVTHTFPPPTATKTAREHYERGLDYQDADDLERAVEEFNQAINLDLKFSDAYFERGRTYALQGAFDLAIADWSQVIVLDPDNLDAHLFRAYAYDDIGDYSKAISDYDMVITYYPQDAELYYWRGFSYAQIGETRKGISDLEEAIDLGLDLEMEKDAEVALDEWRRLIEGRISFNGNWGGNTSQGEVITFEIENNGIVAYSVGFQIPGCESLSPYYTFGGDPRSFVDGNSFSFEDHFAAITGTFISPNTAIGTIEISCESGLTTSWIVNKGAFAVRTPSPDDLAKIPQVEINDDLFSNEDGIDNFDENTMVVAAGGDWFLLRNFSESVLPIPSGWTSISVPDGAYYLFRREGDSEEYSVEIQVGRDCEEAKTSGEFISIIEEKIMSSGSNIEILDKKVVDDRKGYLLLSIEQDSQATTIRILIISKPSKGCFYFISAASTEDNWDDFFPIIRTSVENWYDLSNNFLGVSLPETMPAQPN